MYTSWRKLILAVLLFLLGTVPSVALTCSPTSCVLPHDTIPRFDLPATIASVQAGRWSAASTWDRGRVPAARDKVQILHAVVYDAANGQAGAIGIQAGGALTVNTASATRLTVDTLMVLGGAFGYQDASGAQPFELVFRDTPLNTTSDPSQYSNGLLALAGQVTLKGAAKTSFAKLFTEPAAGATTLTLQQTPLNWQVGDRITIPDTRQLGYTETGTGYVSQTEERTLQSVSGSVATLNAALTYLHRGGKTASGVVEFYPHVQNLSRSVVIKSANPAGTRGHVFISEHVKLDLRYVLFRDLGRTTTNPLDNTTYNAQGQVTHIGTNQVGRYPLHAHHLYGQTAIPGVPQFHIIGNAVDGGTATHLFKWGIAIHDSHYGLVQDNAIYNVSGAGVMFEDGSETGNVLDHNMVMRSTSSSPDRGDGRFGIKDFAHEATCFWFRGPNNYIRNNVAANCLDTGPGSAYGYKYFLHYLGNVAIPNYPGADTSVSGQYTTVSSYTMPVLQFDNNEVYGATESGLQAWWLGAESKTPRATQESVILDMVAWNLHAKAFFNYHTSKLTIDGLTTRGYNMANLTTASIMHEGGDYLANDFTFKHADIEGFKVGINPSQWQGAGFVRFQDSTIRASVGLQMKTLETAGYRADVIPARNVELTNVVFLPIAGMSFNPIKAVYKASGGTLNLIQQDALIVTNYQGVAGANFRVYSTQQAPTFVVPQTVLNADGTPKILGSPVSGLANTQTWATYGLAIGGAIAPCTDSTTRPEILGYVCQ
jgi:hypothetical protein